MLKIAVFLAFFVSFFGQGNGKGTISTIGFISVAPSKTTAVHNSSATSNSTTTLITSTVHINSSHTSPSMVPKSTSITRTALPVMSTAAPNTTTMPPTTTTPRPTTMPPYAKFDILTKPGGNYCILAHFEGTFIVKYESKINKTSNKTRQEEVVVELNRTTAREANTNGSFCKANSSMLEISWPKKKYFVLGMEFMRVSGASGSWKVSRVMLNVNLKDNKAFHNPKVGAFRGMTNNSDISVGKRGNYLCNTGVKLQLASENNTVKVDITLKELKIEPFVNKKHPEFDSGFTECSADHHSSSPTKAPDNNIVPIAVGCALAGLVLIVLIAYIIGRRKSHSGYEKV